MKTAAQLDALGSEYEAVQSSIDLYQEQLHKLRDEIIAEVRAHGELAPRAHKSKTLAGNIFSFTVSTPERVQVDKKGVLKLREFMTKRGFARQFNKIFAVSQVYTLAPGAEVVLEKMGKSSLSKMFRSALKIESCTPRVKVERKAK